MLGERRVVITSFGVVAATGTDAKSFWEGLLSPTHDPTQGLAPEFDATPFFDNPKEMRRLENFVLMTAAVADELFRNAGEIDADPQRFGSVVWASGGFSALTDQIKVFKEKGARRVSPFLIPSFTPNTAAAWLSIRYGLQGPCEAMPSACTSGISCIDHAARTVASGRADLMVAGSSEDGIIPASQAGFEATGAGSPTKVCRPFDAERDGFVQSAGCGLVLLEEYEHAVARGATIHAEVVGVGQTTDAYHLVAPNPDMGPASKALGHALSEAGIDPSQIGVINGHGSGTHLNDLTEARIYSKVFGADTPPITATKGATGHTAGAASVIEVITLLLAMQHSLIPPTTNHHTLDPEMPHIDVVRHGEPRPWVPTYAMSNNFGFGGHNGSIILAPVAGGA